MMQLYSENTCEGVQFNNSKGIQRKRCIFRTIWIIVYQTFENERNKKKQTSNLYRNKYDWPVKYSMKQMHFVNRCVILNNFLSQVSH